MFKIWTFHCPSCNRNINTNCKDLPVRGYCEDCEVTFIPKEPMVTKIQVPLVTKKQVSYIEQLFINVGLWNARKNWLTAELGHPIRYLDELLIYEADRVIRRLKEMRNEHHKEHSK